VLLAQYSKLPHAWASFSPPVTTKNPYVRKDIKRLFGFGEATYLKAKGGYNHGKQIYVHRKTI
jgi:hypothetical protein